MNYKHEPSAFPYTPGDEESGMTLRDWFAGQAVQAMVKLQSLDNVKHHQKAVAQQAYRIADAMLEAREKQP